MSSLSNIPDDILRLISVRLNGFDNCSLWMASDSKLRQRLLNNVITDFDIKYRIPGRYLWPGNFLKKLQKLSRLSLVVDEDMFHLPIENIELYPIHTLKYLQLACNNAHGAFLQQLSGSPTDPTPSSDTIKFINLNDFYHDLDYLKLKSDLFDKPLTIDFLRCLPQNLQTLSIPVHRFSITGTTTTSCVDRYLEILPSTLTRLEIHFLDINRWDLDKISMQFDKLPKSLISFSSNADFRPVKMIPENLKKLHLDGVYCAVYNIDQLSRFLPTGLESLSLDPDATSPCGESLSRFKNLKNLEIFGGPQYPQFITSSVPNLKQFHASSITLQNLQTPPFNNGITTIYLYAVKGITSQFFDALPHTVTSLTLVSSTAGLPHFPFLSKLPKNLSLLRTNLSVNEATSLLPDTLRYLHLDSQDNIKVDRLPSKLETLILNAIITSQSIIDILPETMTHLNINDDVVIDDDIVPRLPRGLKYFRCAQDHITDASSGLFPPHLETLILTRNEGLTDAAIANLPRSLTRIDMKENSNFTNNCISNLPPKLLYINLPKAQQITSQCCKDLPRYLRGLHFPTSSTWKPQKLKDFPKYLQGFIY